MESARAEVEVAGEATERRRHRRLAIRLPVECCRKGQGNEGTIRAVTANISTGGVYFEADVVNGNRQGLAEGTLAAEDLLELELTIPPGEGHFPYERQVRSVVQIIRREDLPANATRGEHRRIGVAGRFHEPLKFGF
jgi:hypothetical protein